MLIPHILQQIITPLKLLYRDMFSPLSNTDTCIYNLIRVFLNNHRSFFFILSLVTIFFIAAYHLLIYIEYRVENAGDDKVTLCA